MTLKRLDETDRRILREVQLDGRLTNVELARRVNLSPTPCLERVKRLERDGFIVGYRAIVDARKMDAGLLVFVEVSLNHTSEDIFNRFREAVLEVEPILECHLIAGGFDYLLKVRFKDMDDYRRFLGTVMSSLPGVQATRTYVCMEEVKETTIIPVPAEDKTYR